MTVQKAKRYLEILIEHRQKVLKVIKEHVDKMKSDFGKNRGNTIVEITEISEWMFLH